MIKDKLFLQLWSLNCNQNLLYTQSMWWNPSYDEPYVDMIIYSLSRNKNVIVFENNPYCNYLKALIPGLIIRNHEESDIDNRDYSFVGRSNMYANYTFFSDETNELLISRGEPVNLFIDLNTIHFSSIRILVDDEGDIYIYGEE